MMPWVNDYKQKVIEYLKSGNVPDHIWEEVADCVIFESENCEALQLDIEIGLAKKCPDCDTIQWLENGEECEVCKAIAEPS